MIVNKSMFPVQTGFSVISKMQDQFATLQMQLGTGVKAQTLADMGRDLPVSLSVRSRLSTIAGYSANIDQVALRLSFYDNALTRMDKIEGEARNSAVQGQYGTNNINMATSAGLSKARLDELVTMLNSDVAGRYLFGGKVTDKAPLPSTDELLDGAGGRAGYKTVLTERVMANLGREGIGRLAIDRTLATVDDPATVTLSEDGLHSFGFKLAPGSAIGSSIGWTENLTASPPNVQLTFPEPPDAVKPGDSITIRLKLPDGTDSEVTIRAVTAASTPPVANEFEIGASSAVTSENFESALNRTLKRVGEGELKAASNFVAAENFFNAAGEPVLRIKPGTPADPYAATEMRVATAADTVMWYSGSTASVSATGMGRLSTARNGATVDLAQKTPTSTAHGFQITGATSSNPTRITATPPGAQPPTASISFGATTAVNDSVTLALREPNGTMRNVTLTAVGGKAGPGQFTLGSTPDETAKNFEAALNSAVTEAAASAEGNPRQSVSAAVEDAGRVDYGMQANETGYLRMIRSFAAMSVETYPELSSASSTAPSDPPVDLDMAKARFDAMAKRQQSELSESRNVERGSIELVTMEIGVARASLQSATERHTNYGLQLENLLSDVETVSKEDVAMEIMALQTRLTASYQVTSMLSQLSLVNFLR